MRAIGSLCSGYGGLELAAEAHWPDSSTVWVAETDRAAARVLADRFWCPNLGDITKIDWSAVEPVDVLCAGFPCQPFSNSGLRKGTDDPRHLWPHVARAVLELRPRRLFIENVRGFTSIGLRHVVEDLAGMGYVGRWGCVRASDAGAAHQRERFFLVARPAADPAGVGDGPYRRGAHRHAAPDRPAAGVEPASGARAAGEWAALGRWARVMGGPVPPLCWLGRGFAQFREWFMGLPSGWITDLRGVTAAQAIRLTGNGVVPHQAELALELLDARCQPPECELHSHMCD